MTVVSMLLSASALTATAAHAKSVIRPNRPLVIHAGHPLTSTLKLSGQSRVQVAATAWQCPITVKINDPATVQKSLKTHHSLVMKLGDLARGHHAFVVRTSAQSSRCPQATVSITVQITPVTTSTPTNPSPSKPTATKPAATTTPSASTPTSAPVTPIAAPIATPIVVPPTPAAPSLPTALPVLPAANPLIALPFYTQPNSDAAVAEASDQSAGDTTDAALLNQIASRPQAIWLTGSVWDTSTVTNALAAAKSAYELPVFVLFNIPERDCGDYSSGGAASASAYQQWVSSIASQLGSWPAAVIIEPDALAEMSCWSAQEQTTALSLLNNDVSVLSARPDTITYLDAGNPTWQSASVMAQELTAAGVAGAQGFALNVSNFQTTADNISYGDSISSMIGGKHFVIDTSRNGQGPLIDSGGQEWCNPAGRGLGTAPTTNTADPLVDAYLWINSPGNSDGNCNGGPAAGTFWPSYALGLAENAGP